MIVYHGTTLEIQNPVIIRNEAGRDFGYAFYTTDIKEQAERWAKRKAMLLIRRTGIPQTPVVNVYEWNRDDSMSVKEFQNAGMDWLDLVVLCRSKSDYKHGYDIVIGKIANDNVGETVSYVVQGIMRKEDAIERLRFEKINNQIAFCSEKSLSTLTFQSSYIPEE